jgi:uncharacterized HAD superfamily protein
MKIYVDLDDVVCDTTSVIVSECNLLYGKNSCLEDVYSFELEESLKITKEQHSELMQHIHQEEIQMKMLPISGAVEYLRTISNMGMDIHIVTGRPPSTYNSAIKWLTYNNVPFNKLVFVNKYNRIDRNHPTTKQVSFSQLRNNNYKAIIDDSPEAIDLSLSLFTCPIIFFIRPWNKEFAYSLKKTKRLYICHDWKEIYSILEKEI